MAVGSLGDAPKDLSNEIKNLEELFTIDTAKLKEITDHFVNELTKGGFLVAQPVDRPLTPHRSQCEGWEHRKPGTQPIWVEADTD
jgi:hexokinase